MKPRTTFLLLAILFVTAGFVFCSLMRGLQRVKKTDTTELAP